MFSTKEFMANMAEVPLVYALNGASVLAAAMHGHGAMTMARFRWLDKQPVFRQAVADALKANASRIPNKTVITTSPDELYQKAVQYGFPLGPANSPRESWALHVPRELRNPDSIPVFLRRRVENQIKTDLVNVPRDDKGTINSLVLRHELGHVKDFGEGKAQEDLSQPPIKHIMDLFKGIVKPDDTALGRVEVRAWDNGNIPAGHPMREAALDTYRHLHRYKLAKMITQLF